MAIPPGLGDKLAEYYQRVGDTESYEAQMRSNQNVEEIRRSYNADNIRHFDFNVSSSLSGSQDHQVKFSLDLERKLVRITIARLDRNAADLSSTTEISPSHVQVMQTVHLAGTPLLDNSFEDLPQIFAKVVRVEINPEGMLRLFLS